jgi:competence protein ComGC
MRKKTMPLSRAFNPKINLMNETIPPITGNMQPPKASALAIWSLVLGILSLVCFSIFAAIPGVICGHRALSKIKRSNGTLAGQGLAIAGLVTGYLGIAWAILFIPLMMAIAIPNFVKARATAQANTCINNLRQIDAAKNEWALENNKTTNDIPTAQDLNQYIKGGFASLHCPAGGTYTIEHVGETPTCSLGTTVTPAHVLPQ